MVYYYSLPQNSNEVKKEIEKILDFNRYEMLRY